jgi:hypothetical protein
LDKRATKVARCESTVSAWKMMRLQEWQLMGFCHELSGLFWGKNMVENEWQISESQKESMACMENLPSKLPNPGRTWFPIVRM